MLPRLSIITVTFNAAATLADTLHSVRCQTVPVEHLLIDGGSTDATLETASLHGPHLAKIISEPDRGLYDAMNKGLRLAQGEIVGILNADDFYPNTDILVSVLRIFDDPAIDACYGDLVYMADVAARGCDVDLTKVVRYWRAGNYDARKFYWGWMPPHPTFFVRRSVYEKYGLFSLEMGTAADYELMLRFLLRHGISCRYLPETLVCMRTGGASNRSLRNRFRANRCDRRAWDANGLQPYPWTIALKPLRKIPQWFQRPRVL